ncbi:hypothetical protein GFS24_18225 [Chitinophaga sp. SYP-B3965]|uniref:RloB family protein n=1 Tax=Chitinophaga sp. SYP-B3965 TaxID=2663120 RepID=UPI00129A01E3|nr:RloB family protein [Chitinophaga sp. SYP-B3965]MRG47066.1 hypothetical protein [Chitinophaga sp. SYP-B3965]
MAKNKSKELSGFAKLMADIKAGTPTVPVINSKAERKYYLIVSQGTETEVLYFKYLASLLPNKMVQVDTKGHSKDTVAVVKKAVDLREQRKKNHNAPAYDEVWALFDKDDFTDTDYEKAIALANSEGIESGHSNECFELWFILHFGTLNAAISRKVYFERLSKLRGADYEKNDTGICEFVHTKGDVTKAIDRAHSLEALHNDKHNAAWNPYTRVYRLVDRLMAHIENREAKY